MIPTTIRTRRETLTKVKIMNFIFLLLSKFGYALDRILLKATLFLCPRLEIAFSLSKAQNRNL